MAQKQPEPHVRIIGSRELHQKLPTIMRDLESNDARYVVTIHGKPKAVLVGASTYLDLVQGKQHPSEGLIGLQLSALLGAAFDSPMLEHLQEDLQPNLDSKT